jgi:hypothetical protein
MSENNKLEQGRPYKMQAWLNQLNQVLEDEDILFLSDKDLQFLVNRKLPLDQQITSRTFENWKAGKFAPDEEIGKQFIQSIQFALIKQKQFLSKKMIDDDKNWQRYAWIMERKFTEWNLKHISENIHRSEQATVIQITAGSDEQRILIDNLINVDYEEIKPKAIQLTNNVKDDDFEI